MYARDGRRPLTFRPAPRPLCRGPLGWPAAADVSGRVCLWPLIPDHEPAAVDGRANRAWTVETRPDLT